MYFPTPSPFFPTSLMVTSMMSPERRVLASSGLAAFLTMMGLLAPHASQTRMDILSSFSMWVSGLPHSEQMTYVSV